MAGKNRAKTGGRQRGTPNKTTALLKDALLLAAEQAGDKEGMVGYLTTQARDNPTAFLSLLGKVLPMQLEASDDNANLSLTVNYVAPALGHDPSDSLPIASKPEPITINAIPADFNAPSERQ